MFTYKLNFSKLSTLLVSSILVMLVACGGGGESEEQQNEDTENQSEASSSDADTDSDEEVLSDEPMESLEYEALQKYLPQSIDGYEKEGDFKGQQLTTPMGSYSQAEAFFQKGDDDLTIILGDYHLAVAQLTTISATWSMSFEDDETKAGGVKLKNDQVKGWEVYNKVDKDANLTLIVGERFLLNIQADNQKDTDFVKSVAESMDLDALIKMGK